MRIKEIYVEVKKSKNFQTYTAGELITVEEGDDIHAVREERIAVCRKAVMNQIKIDQS